MLKEGSIDEFKSLVNEGRGLAKSNLYYVKFPTISEINAYDLGLLCNQISLPSRQMAATPRDIGITRQEIVYGYVNAPISATFVVLNNQKVRSYFEAWHQFILPNYDADAEARYEAKFPDSYMQTMHIYQLERGQSFPLFSKQFDKKIGPFNVNVDLDIDIGTSHFANYHWIVNRAYPSSVVHGELSDGGNTYSTITVEFNYKDYYARKVTVGDQDASIKTDFNINI